MKGIEGLTEREPQDKTKEIRKPGDNQKKIVETYLSEFRQKPANSNNKFLYYAFTTSIRQDYAFSTKFGVKNDVPSKTRIAKRDNLANVATGDKTVATAQASLAMAGYELGKAGIDGIQGKKTIQVLMEFQKTAGLEVTGLLNSETKYSLTMVTAAGLNKAKIEQFSKSSNNLDADKNETKRSNDSTGDSIALVIVDGINYKKSPEKGGGPLMDSRAAVDFKKAINELKQKRFDINKLQFTDMFRSHKKQEHFKEAKRNENQTEIERHGLYWKVAEVSPHELGAGFDIGNLKLFDEPTRTIIIDTFVNNGFIWEGNKDPVHFTWGKIDKSKIDIIQNVWKNKWEQKYGVYNCDSSE
jgi:hypothetical protein